MPMQPLTRKQFHEFCGYWESAIADGYHLPRLSWEVRSTIRGTVHCCFYANKDAKAMKQFFRMCGV